MTDVWSERGEAYRTSEAHVRGEDLDLIAEWAAGARNALDVATGGGHVATRLRAEGVDVVTCDPAPGMGPDVVCRAEDMPFADGSFEVVTCRVAAHHFADPARAVAEMARIAGRLVLVSDNLFVSEEAEEADRLRDPSHVRNYGEGEWRAFLRDAGLTVQEVRRLEHRVAFEPWLERTACAGEEAERVRELLADRVEDGWLRLDRIVIRGVHD